MLLFEKIYQNFTSSVHFGPNTSILKIITEENIPKCLEHGKEYEFYCLVDHVS